jgi:hypothetical protein
MILATDLSGLRRQTAPEGIRDLSSFRLNFPLEFATVQVTLAILKRAVQRLSDRLVTLMRFVSLQQDNLDDRV